MIDRARLLQDARHVAESYEGQTAGAVAAALAAILEDPRKAVPDGYALVKKPELLGLGVPGPRP